MATIQNISSNCTVIRCDSLNAVLFVDQEPVSAFIAGKAYQVNPMPIKAGFRVRCFLNGIKAIDQNQKFFNGILVGMD